MRLRLRWCLWLCWGSPYSYCAAPRLVHPPLHSYLSCLSQWLAAPQHSQPGQVRLYRHHLGLWGRCVPPHPHQPLRLLLLLLLLLFRLGWVS